MASTSEGSAGPPPRVGGRPLAALEALERHVSVLLMTGILILLSAQVFARYVLDSPITWSAELAQFAVVWLTFIAAGLVQSNDEHIAVLFLVARGGRRTQRTFGYLANLVALAVGAAWVYYGLDPVLRGMGTTATATGLPMATVYAATLVGFALVAVHSVQNIVRISRSKDADLTVGLENRSQYS